jgi:hypothetical protein
MIGVGELVDPRFVVEVGVAASTRGRFARRDGRTPSSYTARAT